MAERLLAEQIPLLGFDLESSRAPSFMRLGGEFASHCREVFQSCSRILLSLPNSTIVCELLDEHRDHLSPEQILIDTSTGDPHDASRLGSDLAMKGIDYLDATCSGSSEQVRQREALFMVGGRPTAFQQCADIFAAVACRSVYVGSWGSGAKMKLVTNLVLGLNRAALAEGLVLAELLGLDLTQVLEVLQSSAAASRIMASKGRKMIERDFSPQARLSQHLKDVCLMIAAAQEHSATLPMTETHRLLLERAEQLGFGDQDNSALIEAIKAAVQTQRI
jgi:3-hydroxyisobutyrate dehydrogenase-like beta-hydroxyacid dehydrogenase